MSQEKVDRYKQEKANREQLLKKQKRKKRLQQLCVGLVCLVIVGWVGVSAFNKFYTPPVKTYEIATTALDEFMKNMSTAESETEQN